MTEQELLNESQQVFRDENSDAWKLKGATRASEARAFFAKVFTWVKEQLAGYIKTINGQTPDANGNVQLEIEVDPPILYTGTGTHEDGAMTQKAVTDALTALSGKSYPVFFSNGAREYLDTFGPAAKITAVTKKEGVDTFSYSINGAAFVTPVLPLAAPIALPLNASIKYRITPTAGAVQSLLFMTFKYD